MRSAHMLKQAIAVVALSLAAMTQAPDARDALRLGRTQDDALYGAFSKGQAGRDGNGD